MPSTKPFMKVIGLTGGSGAGKGAADRIFAKYGIPFIDADEIYHGILAKGGACTAELAAAFGKNILDGSGLVDRKALAKHVFGNENTPALLHTLNTITHKYVMSEIKDLLQGHASAGARACVIDAPLLFEANAHLACDLVVAILADKKTRVARIVARDGIDEVRAMQRVAAQKDDSFYRKHCDFVLENNGSEADLEAQIKNLLLTADIGLG